MSKKNGQKERGTPASHCLNSCHYNLTSTYMTDESIGSFQNEEGISYLQVKRWIEAAIDHCEQKERGELVGRN